MKSFKVMAALLIAVDSVKKLLFCFSALTLLFVVASCSNESDLDGFSQESKVLSLANAKKLKNTVDSFNKRATPTFIPVSQGLLVVAHQTVSYLLAMRKMC